MSIAEKPKSHEVMPFNNLPNSNAPCQMITESEMQHKADNGMLSWQEGGNQSNQAVCPSNQFLACPINELSDQAQCHMNTFANVKGGKNKSARAANKMIEDEVEHASQADALANFAEHEESSHLSSDLDTYQCLMTPAKRMRHF